MRVTALRVERAELPAPSLRWLIVAPHRLFFAAGCTALIAVSLWWLAQLAARSFGLPLAAAVPPAWVHGWSMLNGFLPLFMFGFLFTAGPRWLNVRTPDARSLLWPAAASFGGLLLVLAGAFVARGLALAGVALVLLGWIRLLARFFRLIRASRMADKVHAKLVFVFFSVGAVGHVFYALGVAQLASGWIHAAEMTATWFFIAPLYVTVAHRLIPFFTANVVPQLDAWRPLWLLQALLAIVLAHGLLPVAAALVPAGVWSALRVANDAAGAALLAFVAWRWGVVQSLRNRLLAMLHLGFVWLGIALALHAFAAGAVALGVPQAALGLAPLHALTMGFFGSVLLAMATRVTAGHSGMQLVAGNFVWTLFWLLQAAVLGRIVADAWPAASRWLLPATIVLWCAVFVPWCVRNIAIYLRPRADGRPG
jgi:uncharacterized protein involved in response to NO